MNDELKQIRAQLDQIQKLLLESAARPDDLVDAEYIARRTGLKRRTVEEGKAGTNVIARTYLKSVEGKKAGILRFPKRAADDFIAAHMNRAYEELPRARAIRLVESLRRKQPRRRRA